MLELESFIVSEKDKVQFPFQKLAIEKLATLPIPHTKNEHYSYFALKKLLDQSFQRSEKIIDQIKCSYEGIVCERLSNVYNEYKLLLDNHYKKLIESEKDYFALLSYAFASDPLFIYVPKEYSVDTPLDLSTIFDQECENHCFFSNVLIFLGQSAKLHLNIQTQESVHQNTLFSRTFSFHIEDKASLTVESDLTDIDNLWHFDSYRAQLKESSKLFFVSGSLGGLSLRQDFQVDLEGEFSEAVLKGLQILQDQKNAYNHICITHKAENCMSDQHFKQVVFDGGKAVFEGKIFVESQAQKTNAYQLCNSLTLGDKAKVYAKPNLEIFADDVKASHGATTSGLKQDEIFYLLSRGIDKAEAEKFLIEGFCREIADNFSTKEVNCILSKVRLGDK